MAEIRFNHFFYRHAREKKYISGSDVCERSECAKADCPFIGRGPGKPLFKDPDKGL